MSDDGQWCMARVNMREGEAEGFESEGEGDGGQ